MLQKIIIVILVHPALLIALGNLLLTAEGYCPRGYYENPNYRHHPDSRRCLTCSACPVGEGIRRRCSQLADTRCEACVPGQSFSAGRGQVKYCQPCRVCDFHQEIVKKCSAHSDTKCGECKLGFYWNRVYSKCQPCSWCFPEMVKRHEAFVVSTCVRPGIPERFQCAKLDFPPYQQPAWHPSMAGPEETEENESGEESGDYNVITTSSSTDVRTFPTDDEDHLLPVATDRHVLKADASSNTLGVADRHEERNRKSKEFVAVNSETQIGDEPVNQSVVNPAPLRASEDEKIKVASDAKIESDFDVKIESDSEIFIMQSQSAKKTQQEAINSSLLTAVVALTVAVISLFGAMLALVQRYIALKRRNEDSVSIGTDVTSVESTSMLRNAEA